MQRTPIQTVPPFLASLTNNQESEEEEEGEPAVVFINNNKFIQTHIFTGS